MSRDNPGQRCFKGKFFSLFLLFQTQWNQNGMSIHLLLLISFNLFFKGNLRTQKTVLNTIIIKRLVKLRGKYQPHLSNNQSVRQQILIILKKTIKKNDFLDDTQVNSFFLVQPKPHKFLAITQKKFWWFLSLGGSTPLATDWECCYDDSGNMYFWNKVTNEVLHLIYDIIENRIDYLGSTCTWRFT